MAWSERAKKTLDSQPRLNVENAPLEQLAERKETNIGSQSTKVKAKRNLIQEVLNLLGASPKSTQELAAQLKIPYNPSLYHILVALRESGLIESDKGTTRRCKACGQSLKGHYYRLVTKS